MGRHFGDLDSMYGSSKGIGVGDGSMAKRIDAGGLLFEERIFDAGPNIVPEVGSGGLVTTKIVREGLDRRFRGSGGDSMGSDKSTSIVGPRFPGFGCTEGGIYCFFSPWAEPRCILEEPLSRTSPTEPIWSCWFETPVFCWVFWKQVLSTFESPKVLKTCFSKNCKFLPSCHLGLLWFWFNRYRWGSE